MMRDRRWTALWLAVVFVAWAVPAGPALAGDADWQLVDEHWYTVEIAGAKAGWMAESVHFDGERYRTVSEAHISIGRGPAATTIEVTSTFVETHTGQPIMLRSVQNMALQPVDSEWRFQDNHVVHTARQGEREIVKEEPLPQGTWLTPMAVHRYWIERREAGAKEITYRTIDAQTGLDPIEVRHVYVGEDRFEFDGRSVPVTVWKTSTSLLPIEALEKYSYDGHLVYQEVNAGLGKMVTRIATKAGALAVRAGQAPELLTKTFIKPDKPISNAQHSTTATLRLHVNEGTMPALPTAGAQRFEPGDDGATATVTIDINNNQPAAVDEADDDSYLQSSAMVDAQYELVRKLAVQAVSGVADDDSLARLEAMRAFVHRYVSDKGLDTAFATASEVARMKTGDCSEHAVLLCAMLRAQGTPARVAIGLVYAEAFLSGRDIFGWHMWTQGLIDGKWVDLDATLAHRYHAAHVLTGTSSLGDGELGAEMLTTLLLMGNLEIEVLDVGYE